MLEIVTMGDPVLERPAERVAAFDEELGAFVSGMFDAMVKGRGIGLAAPQVGRSLRIFVTGVEGDRQRVFVNPEIVRTSTEEVDLEEGCLSIPGLYCRIKRPASVRVQAFGETGRPFVVDAEGLLARVILHEYDHIEGRLFVDRLNPARKQRALIQYQRMVRM